MMKRVFLSWQQAGSQLFYLKQYLLITLSITIIQHLSQAGIPLSYSFLAKLDCIMQRLEAGRLPPSQHCKIPILQTTLSADCNFAWQQSQFQLALLLFSPSLQSPPLQSYNALFIKNTSLNWKSKILNEFSVRSPWRSHKKFVGAEMCNEIN